MNPFSRCLPSRPITNHPPSLQADTGDAEPNRPSGDPESGRPADTGAAPSPQRGHLKTAAAFVAGALVTGAVGAVAWSLTQPGSAAPSPVPAPAPTPAQAMDDTGEVATPWTLSEDARRLFHLVNDAAVRCVDLLFPQHGISNIHTIMEDATAETAMAIGRELHQQGVNMTQLVQQPVDCCPSNLMPGETPSELAGRAALGIADHLRGIASRLPHVPAAAHQWIGPVPVPAAVGSAATWADAIGIMALTVGLHTLGLF